MNHGYDFIGFRLKRSIDSFVNELSVEQIIEAMKKNGYEQTKGMYIRFSDDEKRVTSACAFGQAALNLMPSNFELRAVSHLANAIHNHAILKFQEFENVTYWNDDLDMTVEDIATTLEGLYKESLKK